MKKVTLFVLFWAISLPNFSQSLGYQDLALLFSKDNNTGTARFNAMSGAFGALGGDVSAIKINPAGASVFKNSLFSASVNSRTTDITSNYYNNKITTQNEYFDFSQAGAVFVYKTYDDSEWSKFAFSFNYSIRNNYDNHFLSSGNSGFSTFTEFPLETGTNKTQYINSDSQNFSNTYNGELAEYNFAISGVYQKDLHLGLAVNTYDLRFSQRSTLREQNNDGNGNTLNASFYQQNITTGTGFSLATGAIYKASKSLRFGFSYQSPIWFTDINEETNILDNEGNRRGSLPFRGDTRINISSDTQNGYTNNKDNNNEAYFPSQVFNYKLKTPAKTTFSAAYVFGKNGLISADYTLNGYQKMKLSNDNFISENQFFTDDLRNTYTLNIGSEWRFKALSLRGGYHYEQSPDANALKSDDIKGYSFGAGYTFGNTKLDFAYQNKSNTQLYNFYSQYNQVNAAELDIDNRIITATLTINL